MAMAGNESDSCSRCTHNTKKQKKMKLSEAVFTTGQAGKVLKWGEMGQPINSTIGYIQGIY